jgi:hypothetical protein
MSHLTYRSAILALFLCASVAPGAELKLLLPQSRTAFQTNEWIDLSVVRSSPQALPAAPLTLTLAGADGSQLKATFPLPAVAVSGNAARQTEHLHVNGWLLRPGKYTVKAESGDASATGQLDVYSHLRKNSFRLINWGRATDAQQLVQGEDSLGYNVFYGGYGNDDKANFIRAGVDFIANCVMSGGHQMDLRQECDWSDPYVTRGGTMRVARRAMIDRTRPNVPGVHFYDEPGLTWEKDPATGEDTPHMIKSQVRAYVAAFGKQPLSYRQVDPKNPEHVEQWKHWATWKLGFMDAAWKEAQFGVSQVRPDFLSLTQSQYGFSAFTDGYYFNVVRSLPITSGHGGYHDYGPGYFNPSYTLEMARARDYAKLCWYLPTWYGNTTPDQFRLEQYLSFQTNIQGMMSPPDLEPATNAGGRQGIVESNHLMARLGPIFTTMPVTRPPVAMLFSLSQMIHGQTRNMKLNYAHDFPQGKNMPLVYLAGKLLQQQFLTVLEEDVLDGTLAADHKAVVLTSIDYLYPKVIAALEEFSKGGGLVLLTGDSTVQIKGAVKLDAVPKMPDQAEIDKLREAKKYDQLGPYETTTKFVEGATPLARAIKAELDKAGIKPVFECSVPTIAATRQAAGDIEYLFAVNATPDDKEKAPALAKLAMKSVSATITLPEGRPVYDAVTGGPVTLFQSKGGKLTGDLRFGPGEMRVFARTARPLGGIRLATPIVHRDLVQEAEPLSVEIAATLIDDKGRPLSGSAPLHVRVIDPLGVTRHELYRATKQGQFQVRLPLAANDPAGEWKVTVSELLNNGEDTLPFTYTPPPRVRSIVGATHRAVYADRDRDNAFRFARLHHDVTIVKGTSAFNDAAAKRLIASLEPWGVRCKVMDLAEASKSRKLTEEEARTWCGLAYAGKGQVKAGDGNAPNLVGFAVQGPVILLGNPEDHPIIKFLLTERFLPYTPDPANFPGAGRGMLTWQRDGVGRGQESISLIAYDEAGMAEAVGSFFEAVAGIEPLTKWTLPASDTLTPAKTAPGLARVASIAWTAQLPDRVVAIKEGREGINVLTHDDTLTRLDAGRILATGVLQGQELDAMKKSLANPEDPAAAAAAKKQERPDRLVKLAASSGSKTAIAYWGGTLRVIDDKGTIKSEQQLPQDVTALTWIGGKILAGLADGRVVALNVKE